MRIHHLNCMTFHLGFKNVTHCLLIEAAEGLLLVDTGLGLGDYAHPTRLVRAFTTGIRVPCDPEETAIRQIVRLGLAPEDVRDIVLTHLHVDHAGGLPDFPWARVHVYAAEHDAAMHPQRNSLKERFYVAAHWAHAPKWVLHSCTGERWFGFDCVRLMEKPVDVLLVPLLGHSRGHCGVAVGQGGKWLLHCGDAYVRECQVAPGADSNPFPGPARRVQHWLFPPEPLIRLRELGQEQGDQVRLFCSHDRVTLYDLRDG
jgi:glyoxylase-like metal-dependent hydrolase (beta-lactamase superfamily II)